MTRTRGSSNTCHVCLQSRMAADIMDCPLCGHKTCRSDMVTTEIDSTATLVCRKCAGTPQHRHPTKHHGRSST